MTKAAEPAKIYQLKITLKDSRPCPPEDCGGIFGYAGFLEAISDPDHEEHKEMLEWIGGEFDPEEFDIHLLNRGLKRIK